MHRRRAWQRAKCCASIASMPGREEFVDTRSSVFKSSSNFNARRYRAQRWNWVHRPSRVAAIIERSFGIQNRSREATP
jgi:hypothetical protein